jgi:hypothetical protein
MSGPAVVTVPFGAGASVSEGRKACLTGQRMTGPNDLLARPSKAVKEKLSG